MVGGVAACISGTGLLQVVYDDDETEKYLPACWTVYVTLQQRMQDGGDALFIIARTRGWMQ